ncbi:MAG: Methyl-coenzyme M reductase I operon protein D [Candidatus Bathyarchaeota archaeon BA2]|nr:MAG: Methyl-coenzyme M reductase I operon protein D [Candidatus Bathyarchaeota archaeon BA2]
MSTIKSKPDAKENAQRTFEKVYRILEKALEEKRFMEAKEHARGLPFKPEIEIFPHRLPSAETVAKFLRKMQKLMGITQITMQGPRVYYETKIDVAGKIIPLKIQVSKFWIEAAEIDEVDKIKDVCNETFPYGFSTKIGRFSKRKETAEDRVGKRPPVIRMDFLGGEE